MKKIISSVIFGLFMFSGFTNSIHYKSAFIMEKYKGEISEIRVLENGKYHDLYCYEYENKIYGYNGGSDDDRVEFVVDNLIDIAIEK